MAAIVAFVRSLGMQYSVITASEAVALKWLTIQNWVSLLQIRYVYTASGLQMVRIDSIVRSLNTI